MAGTLKTNAVQLGDSSTATNNFVLQTNVDGTAKLSRGNLGATTQDIFTIDAAGQVALVANTDNKLAAASGLAPVYGVRAWAAGTSNTTTSPTITGRGNIASITRISVGVWAVVFTVNMPDINFAVVGGQSQRGLITNIQTKTVSGFEFQIVNSSSQAINDMNGGFTFDMQVVR